ncbi:hypothetical protein ABNF97_13900 [Plantactinospora sp. B6F1]|uniref:hypothetical protein n=1 Tax=Plantactinospora sp. B6F1 TaxID=3158971 RepID=UPI00102BE8BE
MTARFVGGRFARVFQVGQPGFYQAGNESLMPAVVRDRFVFDGREVRIATGLDGVNASVGLIDHYHEVVTIYGGPPPGRQEVISLFEQLEFRDSPEGMVIRPWGDLELSAEAVSVYVDGRGTITVPSNDNAADLRPDYKGTPTRYGELWKREGQLPDRKGDGVNTFVYLLGTTRAIAEIVFPDTSEPHETPHPEVKDEVLLEWLYELNPRWEG